MNLSSLVNTLWMHSSRPSLRAFRRSLADVEATQSRVLLDTIRANCNSEYGRKHGFAKVQHVDDFRERVPVAGYELFEPWVDDICQGRANMLTTEPVRLLEPTSGSVSGRRLIPYTDTLKRQFLRGINPWLADLFSERPRLRRGRAYWMVTPTLAEQGTPGGLKIGFADDTHYLGALGRLAAGHIMAVPSRTIRNIKPEDAPFETLLRLLTTPDLTLISIWSPTFLTRLVRLLDVHRDQVISDLWKRSSRALAKRVVSILGCQATQAERLKRLWPRLELVSCWADGSAAYALQELREAFPRVEIQPKGLISTEAFVSFPLMSVGKSALSVRSHFFEFQPVSAESSDTLLAHELSVGARYRIVVTTGGGLYRYQTHDVIEVTGSLDQCPLIRFVGRSDRTSDLVGEKLSEEFVSRAIQQMLQELALAPTFAMLVPRRKPLGYRLLISFSQTTQPRPSASRITETLEACLSENPYYDHAVRVGQLARLATTMEEGAHDGRLWDAYEARCLSRNMRQGDIKPTALETRFLWS